MLSLTVEDIKSIILILKNTMDENRDYLIDLDSVMGDGDLGLTMTKAFSAAHEEAALSKETDTGKLLMKLGMVMAKAAPSTMGTLMATGFMKGGKAVSGVETLGLREFTDFLNAFTQGIIERGKSKPGNKTIIDVLYPATLSLAASLQKNKSLIEGITEAYGAAQKGLEDSKHMKAQHGRAAYYQNESIGKQDPGATVGMFLMKGFYQHISSASTH